MLDTKDKAFLKSCQFGPKNPYCPIFRLGSMVSWTGSDFQEIAQQVGGVPSGSLAWGSGGLRALGLGSVRKREVIRGTCRMGWPRDAQPTEFRHPVRATLSTCCLVLNSWGIRRN